MRADTSDPLTSVWLAADTDWPILRYCFLPLRLYPYFFLLIPLLHFQCGDSKTLLFFCW